MKHKRSSCAMETAVLKAKLDWNTCMLPLSNRLHPFHPTPYYLIDFLDLLARFVDNFDGR